MVRTPPPSSGRTVFVNFAKSFFFAPFIAAGIGIRYGSTSITAVFAAVLVLYAIHLVWAGTLATGDILDVTHRTQAETALALAVRNDATGTATVTLVFLVARLLCVLAPDAAAASFSNTIVVAAMIAFFSCFFTLAKDFSRLWELTVLVEALPKKR